MRLLPLILAMALAGCQGSAPTSMASRQLTEEGLSIRLPNGTELRAEIKATPDDMARGMMYRDQMGPGEAMLFIHQQPGRYAYWMHNVRVPLDIIWLDSGKRVVEISADTPPCLKAAYECGNYGGNQDAQYVVELAGGRAAELGLKVGDQLRF